MHLATYARRLAVSFKGAVVHDDAEERPNHYKAMYPTLNKLEMFARSQRPGWASWGNEIETESEVA